MKRDERTEPRLAAASTLRDNLVFVTSKCHELTGDGRTREEAVERARKLTLAVLTSARNTLLRVITRGANREQLDSIAAILRQAKRAHTLERPLANGRRRTGTRARAHNFSRR